MSDTPEYKVRIYQSKSEKHRNEQKVSEYRRQFNSLQSDVHISEVSVEDIPRIVRDADEDEIHANKWWTDRANLYQRWERESGKDIELIFLERGPNYYDRLNVTHHQIKFDTPFVELSTDDVLVGVFPARVGSTVVDVPKLGEILRGQDSWHSLELDIRDHKQSSSEKHDAWRGNFIERSDELLGEGWNLIENLEFEVAAPEFKGLDGAIDLVYSRRTGEYCLIDIKPDAHRDEFDRGIGQLYRYAELFSRQERIVGAGDIELNLAIASPSIPDGLQAVCRRAGVEPIEIFHN